jgi:hypothetical protein
MALINKNNKDWVQSYEDYLLSKGCVFAPYILDFDFSSLYPRTIGNFEESKYSKAKIDPKYCGSFVHQPVITQ